MRILFLTDGIFPFQLGGMQKFAYYQARYFARLKVELDVVLFSDPKDVSDLPNRYFTIEELKYIRFKPFTFPSPSPIPGHYLRSNFHYSLNIFHGLKKDLHQYDLILAQGFSGWKFADARKKGEMNVPLIVNLHGLEMFQAAAGFKSRMQQYLLRSPALFNLRNADGVCTFGGKLSELLERHHIPPHKFIKLANGVDDSWIVQEPLPIADQPRKFVFAGRFERRKGIEELSQAINQLGSKSIEFHFIGPVPPEKQIRDERIFYYGEIRDAEKVKEIMQQCHVLVCPSHSEGMPTVILEAMACGLAIIATDVGAVNQLLNGNGWLISKPDVPLILKSVENALEISKEELMDYRRQSIKLVQEHFTWEKVTAGFLKNLEEFLESKR